jgi:glycosyltransferase involved in cell wall biosynthesis
MVARALKVQVEGWRFINHSYAVVNRNHLRWMLQDPRLEVSHKEMPLYSKSWVNKPADEFPQHFEQALKLGPSDTPEAIDWVFRIDFPYRLEKPEHGKLLVFATNEYQIIDQTKFSGRSTQAAFEDPDTYFMTPSLWSARAFYEHGVAPERVWVIPHGVDAEDFRVSSAEEKAAYRRQVGIPDAEHVFLHVGAGTFNKGLDVLLMAFAAHCKRHEGSRLMVKGMDGLYGNAINNATKSPTFQLPSHVPFPSDRVIYVGGDLSALQVDRMYRLADSYLSPYRAEGFNMPVLEALVHGLPLAVTKGGSTDDFVGAFEYSHFIDSKPGSLHDDRRYLEPDVAQLLNTLNQLKAGSSPNQGAIERSAQRAMRKFTWEAIVDSLTMRMISAG